MSIQPQINVKANQLQVALRWKGIFFQTILSIVQSGVIQREKMKELSIPPSQLILLSYIFTSHCKKRASWGFKLANEMSPPAKGEFQMIC